MANKNIGNGENVVMIKVPQNLKQQAANFQWSDLWDLICRLKWWILGCVATALLIAFAYLQTQTPIYSRSSWIMLNKNDANNPELDLISEFTTRKGSKKIDNELFILESPSLMAKVVEELGLNTRYYGKRTSRIGIFDFRKTEYYDNTPFRMEMKLNPVYPENLQPKSFYLKFTNVNGKAFDVEECTLNGREFQLPKSIYHYGAEIPLEGATIKLTQVQNNGLRRGESYEVTWTTPYSAAKGFVSSFNASSQNSRHSSSDVITLTITDAIPKRAEDIINTIVEVNNRETKDYYSQASKSAIDFIDQRLSTIAGELSAAENNYKNYQSSRVLVDMQSQSQMTISDDAEYQKQLTDIRLQLQLLNMVKNFLDETPSGVYKFIPANIGVSDAGLNSIIANYNSLVSERNRMVVNSSESNQRVMNLNTQLDDGKQTLSLSIANLIKVCNIRASELQRLIGSGKQKMAGMPQEKLELQQLSRKMDIIEPLYKMLQQKKEEANIKMCSEIDNFRVIERAFGSGAPVSPNHKRTYLIALAIGFFLPLVFVWLRMQLKSKVETKEDVTERLTDTSVLAVIPKGDDKASKLIPENGRDFISESFRMLRSSLQYLPEAKVIQITSSVAGEGKSFVASNLAMSLAHAGKKVVIVGMDLRKPALHKIFNLQESVKSRSVVGYLIGRCVNFEEMVFNTGSHDNLDVIYAGPVPPNPSELLSQNKEKPLFDWLRDRYDYVIIDSTPYMMVSDANLINKSVDVTLYVCRADYTDLRLLNEVNNVLHGESKTMKNLHAVLNCVNLQSSKYRYGYGKGYGYGYGYRRGYGYGKGYGYGYGYGYGDTEEKKGTGKEKNKGTK